MTEPEPNSPRVSVVVPIRNAEGSIGTLLDALEAQTLSRELWELVAVDDASGDRTAEVIEAREWARLVRNPQQRGSAAARNAGVAAARGEIIAFTDGDCVPDPDWLERGLAHFDADPELAMLAGRITITLDPKPTTPALLDAAMFLSQERNAQSGFAVTASMWVRRKVLDEAGGFNERLRWSHSDRELGVLITQSGGKLVFAPDVHVEHPPRSSRRELARKAYRIGRGHAALRRYARIPEPGYRFATNPRYYLPRATLRRTGRLRERGIELGPAQRLRMLVTELLFSSWPRVAGDIVGTLRMALRLDQFD